MPRYLDGMLWGILGIIAVLLAAGVRPAVVAGRSMEPALVPGDVCFASPWLGSRPGDVALFASGPGRPVLHRVVAVGSRGELRTRGDANRVPDPTPVVAADVRGRVVVVLPLGRALRGWMRAVRGATLLSPSRYSGNDGEALVRLACRPGRGPFRLQRPPGAVRAVHSISRDLKARAHAPQASR